MTTLDYQYSNCSRCYLYPGTSREITLINPSDPFDRYHWHSSDWSDFVRSRAASKERDERWTIHHHRYPPELKWLKGMTNAPISIAGNLWHSSDWKGCAIHILTCIMNSKSRWCRLKVESPIPLPSFYCFFRPMVLLTVHPIIWSNNKQKQLSTSWTLLKYMEAYNSRMEFTTSVKFIWMFQWVLWDFFTSITLGGGVPLTTKAYLRYLTWDV